MILGGNSMKAAGKLMIIISLTVITALFLFAGCSPDRKGTALENQSPQVFMVNIPPDGASFSRNPELNWYATDIDGYITLFRYAVIRETDLKINSELVDVETFAAEATDGDFGWDTLKVDLDHPQSTATIRLYADTVSPVTNFVTQYFFVQAQDDAGAKSEIVYRPYSRNNHYPNTHLARIGYSINAVDTSSPAPGIIVSWDGADSTDYGRVKPPLEYEWRLYGPFDKNATIDSTFRYTDSIYAPGTGWRHTDSAYVLDLGQLPDAYGGVEQPVARSEGPKYKTDPNDVWVTDLHTTIYDVFKDVEPPLEVTSEFKFVFWVRTRDDGYLPDPTPAFRVFMVANAKFERPVAVLDGTVYTRSDGWLYPQNRTLVKQLFYSYINEALQDVFPGDSFTVNDFPKGSLERDYFQRAKSQYTPTDSTFPSILNILSHKVIIYFNDDDNETSRDALPSDTGLLMYSMYQGINMGSSGWFMARDVAGVHHAKAPMYQTTMSTLFQYYFGISSVTSEGWLYESMYNYMTLHKPIVWNEQFVGATSIMTGLFPSIDVDTSLLNSRYSHMAEHTFIGTDTSEIHYLTGLPEVGKCSKTPYATPIYVYNSKNGGSSPWHGAVMGVAQQIGEGKNSMKSIAMLFTPTATDSVQTQELFNSSLGWLMEKFLTNKSSKSSLGSSSDAANSENMAIRREGLKNFLKALNEEAERDPKKGRQMGILPPL